MTTTTIPNFYQCGICDCLHRAAFNGDCRNDSERFAPHQLDKLYGTHGWNEVDDGDPIPDPKSSRFLPPEVEIPEPTGSYAEWQRLRQKGGTNMR